MRSRGQQFFGRVSEPGIRALAREPLTDQCVERRVIIELLVAFRAIKNYERHAPESLSRDTPVRPLGNHGVNSFGAPFRRPFHFGNFRERARPDGASSITPLAIQIDKPLLGGTEDHRIVAPPAMRIAMRELLFAE